MRLAGFGTSLSHEFGLTPPGRPQLPVSTCKSTSDRATCHPPTGARNPDHSRIPQPVATVHQGVARATEAARYAYSIDDVSLDR